jgi:hypothetical protein
MLRRTPVIDHPCPVCSEQCLRANARRRFKEGFWKLTASVPVCGCCARSINKAAPEGLRRCGKTDFNRLDHIEVTLRVTNEEKRKVHDVYRRNIAAGAKQAILLGNLEATVQRVVKDADPLNQEALITYLPYLTAERYAADPGVGWDVPIIGVFVTAVVGALWCSNCIGKDYAAFPLMYWIWYAFFNRSKRSYGEVWVQGSSSPAPIEKVAPVNHEQDPLISTEPSSRPEVGDYVHGRLPDGTQTERPRGVQIAHEVVPIELHEDCPGNIQRAIDERITAKQRKPSMTKSDKISVKINTTKFIKAVFTREAVQEAMLDIGSLEDCKSKKWTQDRFDRAYLQALNNASDDFMLKCSIKNEPIPEGKPPRMIVADGDPGQVMALATMSVMEHVLFHRFLDRSVKHSCKADAMSRVIDSLNMIDNYSVVEADGSAWDTCCQSEIRGLTENAIMKHLWMLMREVGTDENGFEDRHLDTNTLAFLRLLKTCPGGGGVAFLIAAIRRSGHRGTSVMNWLINHVLTLTSVNPTGRGDLLDVKGFSFIDRWGNNRRARFAHEGDDTIYTISPPLTQKETKDIVAFWERCGFNMKLFVRERVAEFTGWKIPILGGKLIKDQATPDFLRGIRNGCVTCSREAIDGDYRKVAASKFASYAIAYANVLPTISEMYKNWSEEYGFNGNFTEDDVRGFGGTVPDTLLGLYGVLPEEEEQTLGNLGILRNISYEDFVASALSQRFDMPNFWVSELKYWE